ncbi:MAG: 3-hexulose-6-phosphate synthase [Clostridia bacterium]|nr:3-hexulose-6-phosphate synthase [Clostridia bacterium]
MTPMLQIALDIIPLDEAMTLVEQVRATVDIIEIGTPFIVKEGMRPVKAIKEAFGEKLVLADVKIMDGGRAEAMYAFDAGADIVTVMSVAQDQTIKNVVKAARERGRKVMADMLACKDIAARAAELDEFGVDYICVHTAFDVQHEVASPLEELRTLVDTVKSAIPAVAGGINLSNVERAAMLRPGVIVAGGAIINAEDRAEAARLMKAGMTI